MEQRPWIERTLGESWQTTLTGFGGGGLALVCFVLGRVLNSPDLITAGVTLLTIAVGALGVLARSNAASRKVAGQLDQRIDHTQRQVNVVDTQVAQVKAEVVQVAKDVSKDTAEVVTERKLEEQRRSGL